MESKNNGAMTPATNETPETLKVLNFKISSAVKVSARDAKAAFAALDLDMVEGTEKATADETRDIIGTFAAVVGNVSEGYYRLAVLSALINDNGTYKNLTNPETGKPFASFKELCGAEWFRRHMTTEKGAVLSYPFISQLSSVGKFFYLPALNGDTRYDIFRKATVSALIQFVPFGATDVFPMLLDAFNGTDSTPAKYDLSKLSVKAAKELAKRVDNRENILTDEPAPTNESAGTNEPAPANDPAPANESARRTKRGSKKATSKPTNPAPSTSAPATHDTAPTPVEKFVPVIWFNDGREPVRFPAQAIDVFKVACVSVGQTFKNVLILNGCKAAFALMFDSWNSATDKGYSEADTASMTLQALYKLRAEFGPKEAPANETPDEPATNETPDEPATT